MIHQRWRADRKGKPSMWSTAELWVAYCIRIQRQLRKDKDLKLGFPNQRGLQVTRECLLELGDKLKQCYGGRSLERKICRVLQRWGSQGRMRRLQLMVSYKTEDETQKCIWKGEGRSAVRPPASLVSSNHLLNYTFDRSQGPALTVNE